MAYRYEFDETRVGNLRLIRSKYETIQKAYRQLRDHLDAWNQQAFEHDAGSIPYEREVNDLNRMIEWGENELSNAGLDEIEVVGISVGSMRYIKAALMLEIRTREKVKLEKSREGWPDAALKSLDDGIDRIRKIAGIVGEYEPNEVLWEVLRKEKLPSNQQPAITSDRWDVFISHASEDKEEFVRPLAERLHANGLSVWFDEFTLTIGDSLRRSIDRGLASSRFGVVVVSRNFLRKEWPQKELDGLFAREVAGQKVILPVWHNITLEEVRVYSPLLADRLATNSSRGLETVVQELTQAIGV